MPKKDKAPPRMHVTLGDVTVDLDLPKAVLDKPVKHKSPAEWAYERLILYVQNFEEQLDEEHEAAMGFAGSDHGVIRIEGMGYFDPDIVTFYGTDLDGKKAQLIQHVTQLNVMMRAMPKLEQNGKARRIGFQMAADLEAASEPQAEEAD